MNSPTEQKSEKRNEHSSDSIPAASHYALKLAFHTLKERFEKQKNRIRFLEEENIKLKENKINEGCDSNQSTSIVELEKKIVELSRQKSQLSHHIFMLATENKNHWDCMSKLTEEKRILLDQIRDLNSRLDHLESTKLLLNKSPLINQNGERNLSDSVKEDYVENAAGENEQTSLSSIETVKYLSLNDEGNRVNINELNDELEEVVKKLNEDKILLKKQQAGLKQALESMRKMYKGMKIYSTYLKKLKTDKQTSTEEDKEEENEIKNNFEKLFDNSLTETAPEVKDSYCNSDELICPFCSKVFVKDNVAQEYHEHFIAHVQDCSDDNESVLKSFEVIV